MSNQCELCGVWFDGYISATEPVVCSSCKNNRLQKVADTIMSGQADRARRQERTRLLAEIERRLEGKEFYIGLNVKTAYLKSDIDAILKKLEERK